MQNKTEEMRVDWIVPVKRLVCALQTAGFDTVAVGGCVRDSLLCKQPHDWDLATSASWEQVKAVLSPICAVYETGTAHGTVTAVLDDVPVEITTFRIDGVYQDGRHPDGVTFTTDINKDLARRDFTVNAMAFDGVRLIDPFGGQADLRAGVIRCVGNPEDRFFEDGLRIVRALRFAATLSFSIEQSTAQAIHRQKQRLSLVAPERIGSEFQRLLCGVNAGAVLSDYWAVIERFFTLPFSAKAIDALSHAAADVSVRLAILGIGADQSGEEMETVLRALRLPRLLCETVSFLCDHADLTLPDTRIAARKFRSVCGVYTEQMLAVLCAYSSANGKEGEQQAQQAKALVTLSEAAGDCVCRTQLAIDGNTLRTICGLSGRQIGASLSELLNAVMEERVENTKEALIRYVNKEIARE